MKRTVHRLRVRAPLAALAAGCAGGLATAPGLNSAAGKVFSFNKDDDSFRFLKQDVKYNPATGDGEPW